MKLEIGSEFWTGCTPLNGTGVAQLMPVEMDTRYTLCGRTALELVIRDALQSRAVRSAYLPSYCCHTMIEPFVAKGIAVEFYDIFFTDTGIGCNFAEDNHCDLVFLMDYFGFRNENTSRLAKQQRALGKWVVYDATHSMFCENMDYSFYDYVFGSFRKWFGVNAGFCAKRGSWVAFPALQHNTAYTQTRNDAFDRKCRFIAGENVDKQAFLSAFSCAEEALETDYIGYGPDEQSLQILETVNVEFIRQKRRENAAFAIAAIDQMASSVVCSPYRQVADGECPLFVPLQVEPAVRKLIENQVYLPIHWPVSDLHRGTGAIYDTELSFVCDQRYTVADMARAMENIRSF